MKFSLACDLETRELVWATNILFDKRPNKVKISDQDKVAYALELGMDVTLFTNEVQEPGAFKLPQ